MPWLLSYLALMLASFGGPLLIIVTVAILYRYFKRRHLRPISVEEPHPTMARRDALAWALFGVSMLAVSALFISWIRSAVGGDIAAPTAKFAAGTIALLIAIDAGKALRTRLANRAAVLITLLPQLLLVCIAGFALLYGLRLMLWGNFWSLQWRICCGFFCAVALAVILIYCASLARSTAVPQRTPARREQGPHDEKC